MLRRAVRFCLPIALWALTAVYVSAQQALNRHPVVLDAQGKLLSWVQPQDRAYDRVMRLAWDFLLHTLPAESNGLKPYLTHSCLSSSNLHSEDWPHDPASLYATFVDSALRY